MYWTRNPTRFKEWNHTAPSAEEQEIYSFFDKLPRRLPTRKLLAMYKSSHLWAAFQGMLVLSCVSVSDIIQEDKQMTKDSRDNSHGKQSSQQSSQGPTKDPIDLT